MEEKKKSVIKPTLRLVAKNFSNHEVGKNAAALAYYLLFTIDLCHETWLYCWNPILIIFPIHQATNYYGFHLCFRYGFQCVLQVELWIA